MFENQNEFINSELINSKKGGRLQKWYIDAIILIGYRINSKEVTQFRSWVNKILKEYMVKGLSFDEKTPEIIFVKVSHENI